MLSDRPAPGTVELWLWRLDAGAAEAAALAAVLDAEERARAARFVFPLHGRRFVAGRARLRLTLAGYLGVAADTIYTMVSQRRIPYVKVGRLVRFDRNVIDEWLAKNTVMPLPEKRG